MYDARGPIWSNYETDILGHEGVEDLRASDIDI